MSKRGTDFAHDWVSQNINAGPYAEEGARHHPETSETLQLLLADAAGEGIARDEIEEDVGDLADFVSNAFEEATDAEVERLASRDD